MMVIQLKTDLVEKSVSMTTQRIEDIIKFIQKDFSDEESVSNRSKSGSRSRSRSRSRPNSRGNHQRSLAYKSSVESKPEYELISQKPQFHYSVEAKKCKNQSVAAYYNDDTKSNTVNPPSISSELGKQSLPKEYWIERDFLI